MGVTEDGGGDVVGVSVGVVAVVGGVAVVGVTVGVEGITGSGGGPSRRSLLSPWIVSPKAAKGAVADCSERLALPTACAALA